MSDRLIKKAVFEVEKLLQDTVEITADLEKSAGSENINNVKRLIKIYTEANDWCKAIISS